MKTQCSNQGQVRQMAQQFETRQEQCQTSKAPRLKNHGQVQQQVGFFEDVAANNQMAQEYQQMVRQYAKFNASYQY